MQEIHGLMSMRGQLLWLTLAEVALAVELVRLGAVVLFFACRSLMRK